MPKVKHKTFFNISLLRALRRRHGLTQEALADKLGVNQQTVADWERGAHCPNEANFLELGDLFRIDPTLFLSRGQRLAWENYQLFLITESSRELTEEEAKAKEAARKDVTLLNAVPGVIEVDVMPTEAETRDATLLGGGKRDKQKT